MDYHNFSDEIEYPDSYIQEIAIRRSGSLEADLRHHRIGILKILFRFDKCYSYSDIKWIAAWAKRLKNIINKKRDELSKAAV